jgi:hypothetical protein
MSDRVKELKAELEMAEAEAELVVAKEREISPEKYRALKDDVRAKRQAYRETVRGTPEGTAVQPATVKGKASVA